MTFFVKNLHVYPEASQRVLSVTRGLFFSQKAMLALINIGGMSREKAYEKIQSHAMSVWSDQNESLMGRLQKDSEVMSVLSQSQLDEIFSIEPYLKNINSIYHRLGI